MVLEGQDSELQHRVVTLSQPDLRYFVQAPFEPPNPIYNAVEELLRALGLDAGRSDGAEWNPLGDLVGRGGRVIIKPNLVSSKNLHERIEGEHLQASSTHGSVLRPLLDYALRAVGPNGDVTVVDSPVEGCELDKVARPLGIFAVIDALRAQGHPLRFVDLRSFRMVARFALDDRRLLGRSFNLGLLLRQSLAGDPHGYRVVDLGDQSMFALPDAPPGSKLRFHRSHYATPVPHHSHGRHAYSFGQTILDADLIISIPKLKTHKKTGVTLSLKSAVGLTNQKYWLPHFTEGDPSCGGDEFDRPQSWLEQLDRKLSRLPLPGDHSLVARAPRLDRPPRVIDGSWEGNDTLWRTIIDLNRALLYADRQGQLGARPARRMLSIVDGIVAGEGEGPLGATPVDAGLLVAGCDPCLVDYVATKAMGLDPAKIPTIRGGLETALLASSDVDRLLATSLGPVPTRRFRTPRSWPSLQSASSNENAV